VTTFTRGIAATLLTVSFLAATPAVAAAPDETVTLPIREAIASIPITDEDRTGYDRDLFRHWIDEDGDGCSTRAEVLIAEAVEAPLVGPGCKLTGGSWESYYDEITVDNARSLDIDHMVPLAEAWDSGASTWSAKKRERYANDLGSERSLVAVTARSNRQKSDQDPADWWVPAASASCQYLADWVSTKIRWGLAADPSEEAALSAYAGECPDLEVTAETAE
jgi:hypothetical protein